MTESLPHHTRDLTTNMMHDSCTWVSLQDIISRVPHPMYGLINCFPGFHFPIHWLTWVTATYPYSLIYATLCPLCFVVSYRTVSRFSHLLSAFYPRLEQKGWCFSVVDDHSSEVDGQCP